MKIPGYSSAAYDAANNAIQIRTWDDDGNRITTDFPYEPYLMTEDPRGDHKSIFGTKLRRRNFRTQFDRSKYARESATHRLFENLPPIQQWLVDTLWEHHQDDSFSQFPLKVAFLDIETYSPDSFPNIEEADHTINVITVYDSIDDRFYTWGLADDFDPNKVEGTDDIPLDKVEYVKCRNETELLELFICYIENDYPDILSGWNSEFFDIPYIINRINRVLSEEDSARLSPVGKTSFRMMNTQFGTQRKRYFIEGISCIDYLDIYKRFKLKMQPSYKLDAIAESELGTNKLEFGDMSLAQLSDTDWDRFVAYNIHDVNILVELDKKLQFVSLLRMIAYAGLTTFELAMGTVQVVNGAAAAKARSQGLQIPTFVRTSDGSKNPGAYVGDPLPGFQEHLVSFDATSLYPTVMMSLNMSPETKVGKIIRVDDDEVVFRHVRGETFNLTKAQFAKFVKQEKIAISKAKVLFSQKEPGLISGIVSHYFDQRVPVKKELLEAKGKLANAKTAEDKKKYGDLVTRLNAKQLCIKVLINSIYGYFGNKFAPMGDDDIASSITLTGQAIIKQANQVVKEYIRDKTGIDIEDLKECVVYNDTDSTYISIKILLDALGESFNEGDEITDFTYQTVAELEDYLNERIIKWSKNILMSENPCFSFKREMLADIGLFLAKKRYILHYLDDEGVKKPGYKYTGVDVVRTTMPVSVKPKVRTLIETMLQTRSEHKTNAALKEVYDEVRSLSESDLAKTSGISDYDKWAVQCSGMNFSKGMPWHAKAAHAYNVLLEEHGLDSKYEKIGSGDKVRSFYVKQPNKYGLSIIGFKYEYPPEFRDFFEIDYDKMFDKIVFSVVENLYHAVGWVPRKMNEQVEVDLFELLVG